MAPCNSAHVSLNVDLWEGTGHRDCWLDDRGDGGVWGYVARGMKEMWPQPQGNLGLLLSLGSHPLDVLTPPCFGAQLTGGAQGCRR